MTENEIRTHNASIDFWSSCLSLTGDLPVSKCDELRYMIFVGFRNIQYLGLCFFCLSKEDKDIWCLFDFEVLNRDSFVSGLAAYFKLLHLLCQNEECRHSWLCEVLKSDTTTPWLLSLKWSVPGLMSVLAPKVFYRKSIIQISWSNSMADSAVSKITNTKSHGFLESSEWST
jgi:hypothetical protein